MGLIKKNIFPTPVIGGVGLIDEVISPMSHSFKKEGSSIIMIGKTFGHLEQSSFLIENYSIIEGNPPEINLINEKNNGNTVLNLIDNNMVNAVHDVSDGGLILALSEMAMGTNLGVKIEKSKILRNSIAYFFGEDQGRYLLEVDQNKLASVEKIISDNNVYYENIGFTQKNFFEVEGELKVGLNELFKINNQWYNEF